MSNSSDVALKPERRGLPTPDRFERLGYGLKHARKPLRELDLRSQLMLEYMLVGTRHKSIADRIGVEPNEPMSQQQASDAVGLRRRNGRFIFSQPVFQKALAKGIEELRSGHRVKATLTQIELMNDRGDGSAAAGTLRLKASQALLGDGEGKGGGVNVNVQVNNGVTLTAGVVVRLPSDVPLTPLETQPREDDPRIIDARPIEGKSEAPEGLSIDPEAELAMRRSWPNTAGGE